MRGSAELVVISHVEMQGDEGPHLQDILRQVRNYDPHKVSKGNLNLNEHDKDLLRRFDEAMNEANRQANKELSRLRPIDDDGAQEAY